MARFIQCVKPLKLPYGGAVYTFAANELGDFIAEVADDQHYEAILSIGAGYQPYGAASIEKAVAAVEERIKEDTADRMERMRAAKAAKRVTAGASA